MAPQLPRSAAWIDSHRPRAIRWRCTVELSHPKPWRTDNRARHGTRLTVRRGSVPGASPFPPEPAPTDETHRSRLRPATPDPVVLGSTGRVRCSRAVDPVAPPEGAAPPAPAAPTPPTATAPRVLGRVTVALAVVVLVAVVVAVVLLALPVRVPAVQQCGTPAMYLIDGRVDVVPDPEGRILGSDGEVVTFDPQVAEDARRAPCQDRVAARAAPAGLLLTGGFVLGLVAFALELFVVRPRARRARAAPSPPPS